MGGLIGFRERQKVQRAQSGTNALGDKNTGWERTVPRSWEYTVFVGYIVMGHARERDCLGRVRRNRTKKM